jgi:hypothetical protein
MKLKLLLIVATSLLLVASAQSQTIQSTRNLDTCSSLTGWGCTLASGSASSTIHSTVSLEIPGHYYVIDFAYSLTFAEIPLTNPLGVEHYPAEITVSEVIDGQLQRIGETFSGTYTGGKCFEDIPEELVERALNAVNKLTPELRLLIDAHRATVLFESQPLYRVNGGVLEVTERGARDMDQVKVDGKVVWERPGYVAGSGTAGSLTFLTSIGTTNLIVPSTVKLNSVKVEVIK